MADTAIEYENHLKKAYSVRAGEKVLAITDTSCYHLAEETAWLTANLPETGPKAGYLCTLAELGLTEPEKIFNKLISLGALREKARRTWKDILRLVLTPQFRLIPAQWQERLFGFLLPGPAAAGGARLLIALSAAGLIWGTAALWYTPAGKADGILVVFLVLLGSLIHELGHSFTAMAAGIGLRPIGFSVYLVYPVFYTNVSGIEKVPLAERALIDCGGFIFQGVFLLALLLAHSITGNTALAEAVRWMLVIIFFNLNPLFRTDGYWLYQDVYSEFKTRRWARTLHYLYLAAFLVFSVYFLWRIGARLGSVLHSLNMLVHSPGYFFSGGYRVILGAYFVFIGLTGGLRRFQEGRQEWKELREQRRP